MEPKNLNTESLNKFVSLARTHKRGEDIADTIADTIGTLERDAYLALVAEWKQTFKAIAHEIREAKVMRKTADTETERNQWNYTRWQLRSKANALMAARKGIKQVARRHWVAKQKSEFAA
ncbi:hypothetical protein [Mesorhizobium sp. SP-1A]|uniref:hypothetical protein n=1 Tax=Mesorhizobium sp. SP-1A TaxID=3077840 RepID=UPI0028F6C782|nr:hypothetical protein [Mesorhizobium sp. SP-1A]